MAQQRYYNNSNDYGKESGMAQPEYHSESEEFGQESFRDDTQMGQPRSYRIFYKDQMGRSAKNYNISGFGITNQSAVLVTAAKFIRPPSFFDQNARLSVHSPDVYVTNIAPHGPEGGSGGVEFMLHVDSNTPVDVAVTITVFGPFEGWDLI